jgi:hypothetical protein
MGDVDDRQVAERLLKVVAPGDGVIRGWIRAGESIPAVVTLIEMAAQNHKPIPDELRVAVRDLVDEGTFDYDEQREVVEDLATLANQTPSHT